MRLNDYSLIFIHVILFLSFDIEIHPIDESRTKNQVAQDGKERTWQDAALTLKPTVFGVAVLSVPKH